MYLISGYCIALNAMRPHLETIFAKNVEMVNLDLNWGGPIDDEDVSRDICYYVHGHPLGTPGREGIVFWHEELQKWQGYFEGDFGWPNEDRKLHDWSLSTMPYLLGPAWSMLPSHPCGACDNPVFYNDYLCDDCRKFNGD